MERFNRQRLWLIIIIVLIISGGTITRLFSLQILKYGFYQALAQNQHDIYKKIFPQRGEIFMQDWPNNSAQRQYQPVAINKEFYQLYVVPKKIPAESAEAIAEQLAQLTELDKEFILEKINKENDPYEPLKHKLDPQVAEKIRKLNLEGVGLLPETWRYYPYDNLLSQLTGFVGIVDDKKIGQYGLEGYYEEELKGKMGYLIGEKDVAGYWIPSLSREFQPTVNGSKLILTIDQNVQFKAAKELKKAIDRWQAEGGTVIVMEPTSGAVRAMFSWPNFNPNQYQQVEKIDYFLNPAIQKIYEPGSVFKVITMAAGLDSQKITPQTTYQDKGLVMIKNIPIRNSDGKVYGLADMSRVLEKSINTGAVFVQQQIGQDIFRDYIKRFGFGQLSQIDLFGEVKGDISNIYSQKEIDLATIAFGQGISVTPLQMIRAVSAIANQGQLVQPFVVEKIIGSNGQEKIRPVSQPKQIISKETAEELTKMMVNVVEKGYGRPARISGYDIAGKTGTAQVPEKGGYSEKTIHTFVGFAPAFKPRFAILVKLDNPQGIRFAADSVTPVFKNIAKFLFNYLSISP